MGHSTNDERADPDDPGWRRDPKEKETSSDGASAWRKALRDVAPYLDLGWRLAGTAAFPPLIGYLIDQWLQTTPGFLLAGCVFGLAGAILQLVRLQGDIGA